MFAITSRPPLHRAISRNSVHSTCLTQSRAALQEAHQSIKPCSVAELRRLRTQNLVRLGVVVSSKLGSAPDGSGELDAMLAKGDALSEPEDMAAQDAADDGHNAAGGWPLQRTADQCLVDLLHPRWHIRHGAALGLRQVLTHHAPCAAVQAPVADPVSGVLQLGHGLLMLHMLLVHLIVLKHLLIAPHHTCKLESTIC
jgi:hypothetical protein